jgi:hypothetical protein
MYLLLSFSFLRLLSVTYIPPFIFTSITTINYPKSAPSSIHLLNLLFHGYMKYVVLSHFSSAKRVFSTPKLVQIHLLGWNAVMGGWLPSQRTWYHTILEYYLRYRHHALYSGRNLLTSQRNLKFPCSLLCRQHMYILSQRRQIFTRPHVFTFWKAQFFTHSAVWASNIISGN